MSSHEKYLLTALIAVFLFVFYRWLKRFLHRNEIQEVFPYVFPFEKEALQGMDVVRIELPQKQQVRMVLHSADGTELRLLHDAELSKGEHSIALDCRGLESGRYELRIQFNRQLTTRTFAVKAD